MNTHGRTPSDQQATSETIEHVIPHDDPILDVTNWPAPFVPTGSTVRLGLPASWEDMEALGLDPLTGEPT